MKNMSRIVLFMIPGFFLTLIFQNCGEIQPGLDAQDSMAIVTDQNDNLVSILSSVSPQILDSQSVQHAGEVASNDHQEEKKVEEVKADANDVDCERIAKKFNSTIDIDQIGEEYKINLSSDKTFIYSKSGLGRIDSISIERVNGRTVLCKVDVQNFKLSNGRLELIQSKVRHLERKNGVVIKDENSVVD